MVTLRNMLVASLAVALCCQVASAQSAGSSATGASTVSSGTGELSY